MARTMSGVQSSCQCTAPDECAVADQCSSARRRPQTRMDAEAQNENAPICTRSTTTPLMGKAWVGVSPSSPTGASLVPRVVGYVDPEPAFGGPIALVQDSDRIRIDSEARALGLLVDATDLARRRAREIRSTTRARATAPSRTGAQWRSRRRCAATAWLKGARGACRRMNTWRRPRRTAAGLRGDAPRATRCARRTRRR